MVAFRCRLANAALHPTRRRRHDLRVEHDIVNPGVEEFAFVEVELTAQQQRRLEMIRDSCKLKSSWNISEWQCNGRSR